MIGYVCQGIKEKTAQKKKKMLTVWKQIESKYRVSRKFLPFSVKKNSTTVQQRRTKNKIGRECEW